MTYWLNRTLCDVLEEMRACKDTLNFSYLKGLIEEAQSMANQMEAALADKRSVKNLRRDIKELKAQKEKLDEEIKERSDVSS
jgi:hypothetical protein